MDDPGDAYRPFGLEGLAHDVILGPDVEIHARPGGAVAVPRHHSIVNTLAAKFTRVDGAETTEHGHFRRRWVGQAGPAGMVVAGGDNTDPDARGQELM